MELNYLLSIVAANTRRFRVNAGLSQAELAEKTGFTTQQIDYFEAGSVEYATLLDLLTLARALGVSVESMLKVANVETVPSYLGLPQKGNTITMEGVTYRLDEVSNTRVPI